MMCRAWEIDAAPVNVGSTYTAYVAVNVETREIFEWSPVTTAEPAFALSELLERIVAAFGVPEMVITDNALAFTSATVEALFARLGIRHELRRPYSAWSMNAAERALNNCLAGV